MRTIVWDCFIFNGESEALKTRLHQLCDCNIRHVLVEASSTFTGVRKSEMFYHREKLPSDVRVVEVDLRSVRGAWEKEYAQRNAIVDGLTEAKPFDIVMISDVDEIPTKTAIEEFDKKPFGAMTCVQKMWYYSWKWKLRDPWYGTVITTKIHLNQTTPQKLRDFRKSFPLIHDGGIHMSYFGGMAEIKRKLVSFAHEEYAHVAKKNKRILESMMKGKDLFCRASVQMDRSRRPNRIYHIDRRSLKLEI